MRLKNLKLAAGLLFVIFGITGCASINPMSQQDRQEIHTITVDDHIKVNKNMYYMTPSSYAPIALGGIVGGLLTAKSTDDASDSLKNRALERHVYVDQIVRNQFIEVIKEDRRYKVVNTGSDAVLYINIPIYGVSIPYGISTQLSPILSIDAKIVKNGKIVWSYKDMDAPAASGVPRYTIDEINKNPLLLKEMWAAQAHILITRMISTM